MYATGNVNLRSPHCLGRKDEAMHPIHLATIGGNVKLVRWLVSERYCPLEAMDPKRRSKNEVVFVPIVTSKGKTALEIALLHQRLDIVHYFVAEQRMSMFNLKNIGADVAISNLTTLLNMMPSTFFHGMQMQMTSAPPPSARPGATRSPGTVKRRPSL